MFSVRLKQLREEHGYKSQNSFAKVFNVAQSTVAGWESGAREPNFDTTIRLANFFHVSVDYLLGQSDSPMYPIPPELSLRGVDDEFVKQSILDRLALLQETKEISSYENVFKSQGSVSEQNIKKLTEYYLSMDYSGRHILLDIAESMSSSGKYTLSTKSDAV